jgi:uncharacterized protein (TIGR03086 family)
MVTVRTQASVSLDGYLAEPDELLTGYGALVVGRRQFDVTNGWGGKHPLDVPVFVVTHAPPAGDWLNVTFVTEGVPHAVALAAAAAGDNAVGIGPGSVVRQALDAGLLDEIRVDLAPVLLGAGVRFAERVTPTSLGAPEVTEGDGVTHLVYPVVKDPIALVARTLDQMGTVIAGVRPDQAALPTPCAGWDVRTLVNHVVDEVLRFAEATATGVRGDSDGDVLGADWTGAFERAAAALLAAWRSPGALERTTRFPGGEVPATWTIGQHVTELAVHAWDIAVATGQSTDLDPVVGGAAFAWARANLVPEIRGEHIGHEVRVAEDAPLYDRLAGFGGRTPRGSVALSRG